MYKGEERRKVQEEQLGYISAKVESMQRELSEFKDSHKEYTQMDSEFHAKMEEKLDILTNNQNKLIMEITWYKRIIAASLSTITGLIALLWKDILELFK